MKTFWASVDQKPLQVVGQQFHDSVQILGQPTYGRFLFTTHDILFDRCVVDAQWSMERFALYVNVINAMISNNTIIGRRGYHDRIWV